MTDEPTIEGCGALTAVHALDEWTITIDAWSGAGYLGRGETLAEALRELAEVIENDGRSLVDQGLRDLAYSDT